VGGSYIFVSQIKLMAVELAIPVVLVALLISTVATELPGKFNSFIWIRQKKDTFAIGNITGAMVFQSCIPVTVGVVLISWAVDLGNEVDILDGPAIGIAILTAVMLYLRSRRTELGAAALMTGGALFLAYLVIIVAFL
jgi:cation:H+ antiporter